MSQPGPVWQEPADRNFVRVLAINMLVPVLAITLLGGLLVVQGLMVADEADWVSHSQKVVTAAYRVSNLLNRMESGQRGYLLTGKAAFRKPYDNGVKEIDDALQTLATLSMADPLMLDHVHDVQHGEAAWQNNARAEMAMRDRDPTGTTKFFEESGSATLMERLRETLSELRDEESALKRSREAHLENRTRFATALGLFGFALAVAFFALFSFRQYRQLNAAHQANVRRLHQQARAMSDLTEQLREQNEGLESRVLERTEELRVAKDEAETASRAKSSFLANMSHELRTPLNAILGYSEMLEEEAPELGADSLVPDLQKINLAGKHLLGLINDILDLSKIEAGKMALYIEEIEPTVLFYEVIQTVKPLFTANGNAFEADIEPEMPNFFTDVTKVRQSLFNLLSNAAKFTKNGRVTLTARCERTPLGDWLLATVQDTGIGMTEVQLARLFQEFAQADESTTRRFGGTGLGLAISQRFCHMLDGDIEVTSTAGTGSSFTIRLPMKADPNSQVFELADALDDGDDKLQRTRVLVIDDDPRARELVTRYLTRAGYEVRVANAGSDGLAMARSYRPDAVILDVIMPGLDGWSVLTALKADPELADIPVLMATMVDDRSLGYALGASDFLIKPVERIRLLGALRRAISGAPEGAILVVDDDPSNRALMRGLLSSEGYEVELAEDGQEALGALDRRRPAAVVLDLMMPVMDGFAFIEEVRKRPGLAGLPIVVVTSMDLGPADRERLAGTVHGVLAKATASPDRLMADLVKLLRRLVPEHAADEAAPADA